MVLTLAIALFYTQQRRSHTHKTVTIRNDGLIWSRRDFQYMRSPVAKRPKEPTAKNPHGLTDQQLRFCQEYARSLDRMDAYHKAGYKAKNNSAAWSSAHGIINNPKVKAYLDEILNLTEVSVINEMVLVAFAKITDVVSFDGDRVKLIPSEKLNNRGKAAIKKIKIKKRSVVDNETGEGFETIVEAEVDLHDKLSALDKLARKLRLYPKEMSVMDAIATLASQGLLLPQQAELVKNGLSGIEQELRSLSGGAD